MYGVLGETWEIGKWGALLDILICNYIYLGCRDESRGQMGVFGIGVWVGEENTVLNLVVLSLSYIHNPSYL